MSEEKDLWDESNPLNPLYDKHLFELGDAVDEVRIANGAGETAGAATKLVAKTVANTTVFAAKLGWSVFKSMAEKAAELAAQKK